ncbi:MAG: hypothetical protein GWP91_03605 [Rhodobacterales bacterium]|nr:hypothetical protein [Rhodobacterales bacterium]
MQNVVFFTLSLLLAGCGGDAKLDERVSSEPTWYGDIEPLVAEHCARCHNSNGVGPGDFTDYNTASTLAALMVAKIDSGEMPPPAADPGCADYLGSESMHLDEDEQQLIRDWTDGGALEGDPSDALGPVPELPTLQNPDIETYAKSGFTPTYTDNNNEYRCFLLDETFDSTTYFTAVEPILDQFSVSHHSVLFLAPEGSAEAYITDPTTDSWECPDVFPDGSWTIVYAWAPGNDMIQLDPGYGLRVPAGQRLVLQMHYFKSGPEADQVVDTPGYRFETTDSIDNEIYMLPLGPSGFTIPAGDASYEITQSLAMAELGIPLNLDIHGVFPHMHTLGKSYHFFSEDDNDESCITKADKYEFNNQPTYWFKEPVRITPEATVHVSCTYDNSADSPGQFNDPPQDVSYGERTDQEMCFALMYASIVL